MYQDEPDKNLLSRLDVKGVKVGDTIIFCPKCLWQAVNAAVANNVCPQCCIKQQLHMSKVDQELIDLCAKRVAANEELGEKQLSSLSDTEEVNEAVQFLDRNIFNLDLILELAELRELIIWQQSTVIVTAEDNQKRQRLRSLMAPLTPEQREMVTNGTVITEQLRDLLYTEALQAGN